MAKNLELFVNAYALVDDVDSLMEVSHQEWTAKDTADKEDLIKRATTTIDTGIEPAGEKLDENQDLEFLRIFDGNWEPVFSQAGQEKRLLLAVVAQITMYLNEGAHGKVQEQIDSAMRPESTDLDTTAKSYLDVYVL